VCIPTSTVESQRISISKSFARKNLVFTDLIIARNNFNEALSKKKNIIINKKKILNVFDKKALYIYTPHSSTLIRVHFIPHSLILSTLFYPRNNFVDNVEQVLRDSNHHEPPGFRSKLKYGYIVGENWRPKFKKWRTSRLCIGC